MAKVSHTILQLVLVNDTGDSYYRMRWPAMELARQNPDWQVINLSAAAKERFQWALSADLLVLFQSQDYDLLPILESRRARGLKTLVEYNDNFYSPPPWSPVAEPWSSPLIWQAYESFIDRADALLVTGPGLVELFRTKTKTPIEVLPNHIPKSAEPIIDKPKTIDDKIRIGWAGSLGHMADLLSVVPILRSLVARYPQVEIHMMGNETIPQLLNLPPGRLVFRNWGSMEEYFDFWTPIHLGIIPLLDTPYNRCRSDIKAVEMIARGVLPIVPAALPYQELLTRTHLPKYSTFAELERQIEHFILNPDTIASSLVEPINHINNCRLERVRTDRSELYKRYLSAGSISPQSVNWPNKPGYFEVEGTTEASTPSHAVLLQVQELWNGKRREEALKIILSAANANPGHPEFLLAAAKCLLALKHPQLNNSIEAGIKRFPRDLRFSLLKIQSQTDDSERIRLWKQLVDSFRASSPATVFHKDILRLFISDLTKLSLLTAVARELILALPDNPEFRLALAETLERRGEYAEALYHFEQLAILHRAHLNQRDYFANSDQAAYVSTWVETLRGRLRVKS